MPDIRNVFKSSQFNNEQHKALLALLYLGNVAEKHIEKTLETYQLPVNKYWILKGLKKIYPQGVAIYKLRDFLIEANADTSRLADRLLNKGLSGPKRRP